MTTIVWDGKTLATDSLETVGTLVFNPVVQKLFRNLGPFSALTMCGASEPAKQFINTYVLDSSDIYDIPSNPELLKDFELVGILRDTGECWCMNAAGFWEVDKPWAFGSGNELAIAALDLGKTAPEAVKYVASRDTRTNSRVQQFTWVPSTKSKKEQ